MSTYQLLKPGKVESGCTYVRSGAQPKEKAVETLPANRQRIAFFKEGDSTPVTSLWAEVTEDGITLEHEYPDFEPVGMFAQIGSKFRKVAKQTGRQLTLEG